MEQITDAANWVSAKLRGPYDYTEKNYQTLLIYALQKRKFITSSEENITYTIQDGAIDIVIGYGRLDLKVIAPDGDVYILELKQAETLSKLKSYKAQLKRYLRHCQARGALIVFNSTKNPYVLNINSDT